MKARCSCGAHDDGPNAITLRHWRDYEEKHIVTFWSPQGDGKSWTEEFEPPDVRRKVKGAGA